MMDIQTIEQIILMLGNATDSAVTIAILWIVGGYLMTITGWGVFVYIVKLIVERIYSVYNCPITKSEHQAIVTELASKVQDNELMAERHYQALGRLSDEHQIELEKIKHLYKILKESKDV